MAEFTNESIVNAVPQLGKKMVFVGGTSAGNGDTITVAGLGTVEGAVLVASDGTAGTLTFATNVITVTNGGALAWTGIAWGY